MALEIVNYNSDLSAEFEMFRHRALAEGNESLIAEKLDPAGTAGNVLLCFFAKELVSVSVAEPSHYTGDPEIACRICRYHVLEEYRNRFLYCGFQMLEQHCRWADAAGFKVVYFTHDIRNKPLNALYQKKRKYALGAGNEWFDNEYFKAFEVEKNMLFKVSPLSPMLQYIYSRKTPADYQWQPRANVIWTQTQ